MTPMSYLGEGIMKVSYLTSAMALMCFSLTNASLNACFFDDDMSSNHSSSHTSSSYNAFNCRGDFAKNLRALVSLAYDFSTKANSLWGGARVQPSLPQLTSYGTDPRQDLPKRIKEQTPPLKDFTTLECDGVRDVRSIGPCDTLPSLTNEFEPFADILPHSIMHYIFKHSECEQRGGHSYQFHFEMFDIRSLTVNDDFEWGSRIDLNKLSFKKFARSHNQLFYVAEGRTQEETNLAYKNAYYGMRLMLSITALDGTIYDPFLPFMGDLSTVFAHLPMSEEGVKKLSQTLVKTIKLPSVAVGHSEILSESKPYIGSQNFISVGPSTRMERTHAPIPLVLVPTHKIVSPEAGAMSTPTYAALFETQLKMNTLTSTEGQKYAGAPLPFWDQKKPQKKSKHNTKKLRSRFGPIRPSQQWNEWSLKAQMKSFLSYPTSQSMYGANLNGRSFAKPTKVSDDLEPLLDDPFILEDDHFSEIHWD